VKKLRALGAGGACLTVLGVACAFAAPAVTTTACTTHQCDTDFVNIDQSTGGFVGDLQPLGPGTAMWESSAIDGTWIDFPGMRTYFFSLPQYFVPIGLPLPYVATAPDANDPDAGPVTYVLASGQLAEFGGYVNGGFLVTNSTCAEYYLYVSVDGYYDPPPPPTPAADDAGDGGAGD
jgi:hypothetical protein